MTAKHIIESDGLDLLATQPAGSVDAVISDLPSGKTKAPFDTPAELLRLQLQVGHALRPTGNAVFLCSHLDFAARVLAAFDGWRCHDLVWEKGLATGFLAANRQPLRAHEHVLIFSRGTSTYNKLETEGHAPMNYAADKPGKMGANYGELVSTEVRGGKTTRVPRSVFRCSNVAPNAHERVHPQQKPVELMRWLVRLYSNPGDLIVDPYAGSGTTGEAALLEGRRFQGAEIDPEFAIAARLRLGLGLR